MRCPVCGGEVPARGRGRPLTWCSPICRERARLRRRQAARLMEWADGMESSIGRPGFGSAEAIRRRAADNRDRARELLGEVGE